MDYGFRIHFKTHSVYVEKNQLVESFDGTTRVFKGKIEHIDICWTFQEYGCGQLIDLELSSETALNVVRVDSVVIKVEKPKKTARIAFLGRNMYENENRFPSELAFSREYTAECTGVLPSLDEKGVLIAGCIPFNNIYKSVAKKNDDGTIELCAKTAFTESMLEEKNLSAERVFLCNTDINSFFDAYRSLIPESTFPMPKLKGWNTWDYYLDRVKPEDITENVNALKNSPLKKYIDYIVIDDGWQKSWGQWRENEKFACSLKSVADSIRQAGFIPGIWMAPVSIQNMENFDTSWFLKDEAGNYLIDGLYYIDPTHPEAEKFILDNYKYQYKAGFRLFKMDYVSKLLKVKNFYDKKATSYSALRRLVKGVKEVTGDDIVILGCSLPLECGADIAPSMRIGVDIHNHFSHVKWIARSLAWSWMYNLKTTRIDVDFLVVRGEETADEPLIWEGERNSYLPPKKHKQTKEDILYSNWRHGDQFDFVEAETWANLVAISGGNVFLSDRMSVLNEKGISIIENAMKIEGETVRPYYQKDDDRIPSLWIGDKGILVINWEDVPRKITVSGIKNISSSKDFQLIDGVLTVYLLPHESFSGIYC